MFVIDKLNSIKNRISAYQTVIEQGYPIFSQGGAFTALTNGVIDILSDLLTLFSEVFTNGQPYPPSDLLAVHVASDHVDLQWTTGYGNIDYQRVFRMDSLNPWAQVGLDLVPGVSTFTDNTVVAGTTYQYKVIAYNYAANPVKHTYSWNQSQVAAVAFPANITANVLNSFSFVTLNNGRVRNVSLYLEETGTDLVNPLELEADVEIGGFTIFTTKPKITKDAPDYSSTLIAGAGITQSVIDNTQNFFALGARVAVDLSITRTAPGTEMAGAVVEIEVELGNPSASDDSNILNVVTLTP